jgi:8-oxo-dGTP pyrophosphatase MutT (NUDIX family)
MSNKKETAVSSVAAFNPDGKLLFGLRGDSRKWTLPGGHANEGESPEKCAVRELVEEAGLKPLELEHVGDGRVPVSNGEDIRVSVFRAAVEGEPTAENDPDGEIVEFQWVDVSNGVPDQIANNLFSPMNVALRLLGLQGGKVLKSEQLLVKSLEQEREIVSHYLGGDQTWHDFVADLDRLMPDQSAAINFRFYNASVLAQTNRMFALRLLNEKYIGRSDRIRGLSPSLLDSKIRNAFAAITEIRQARKDNPDQPEVEPPFDPNSIGEGPERTVLERMFQRNKLTPDAAYDAISGLEGQDSISEYYSLEPHELEAVCDKMSALALRARRAGWKPAGVRPETQSRIPNIDLENDPEVKEVWARVAPITDEEAGTRQSEEQKARNQRVRSLLREYLNAMNTQTPDWKKLTEIVAHNEDLDRYYEDENGFSLLSLLSNSARDVIKAQNVAMRRLIAEDFLKDPETWDTTNPDYDRKLEAASELIRDFHRQLSPHTLKVILQNSMSAQQMGDALSSPNVDASVYEAVLQRNWQQYHEFREGDDSTNTLLPHFLLDRILENRVDYMHEDVPGVERPAKCPSDDFLERLYSHAQPYGNGRWMNSANVLPEAMVERWMYDPQSYLNSEDSAELFKNKSPDFFSRNFDKIKTLAQKLVERNRQNPNDKSKEHFTHAIYSAAQDPHAMSTNQVRQLFDLDPAGMAALICGRPGLSADDTSHVMESMKHAYKNPFRGWLRQLIFNNPDRVSSEKILDLVNNCSPAARTPIVMAISQATDLMDEASHAKGIRKVFSPELATTLFKMSLTDPTEALHDNLLGTSSKERARSCAHDDARPRHVNSGPIKPCF